MDKTSPMLNGRLTETEMQKAFNLAAKHKAAGPDNMPGDVYKMHFSLHAKLLCRIFNLVVFNNNFLPGSNEAKTVLLPKRGEKKDLKNWRPISLINSDANILSILFVQRLNVFNSVFLEKEQIGFVKGELIHKNVYAVNLVIQYNLKNKSDGAVVFLDQEKAYDRVSHEYMFHLIKKINIGFPLVSWLKMIYKKANTSILVNGKLTRPVFIGSGLRQGDPLSPLLYNLVFDPLISMVKETVKGLPLYRSIDLKSAVMQMILLFSFETTLMFLCCAVV